MGTLVHMAKDAEYKRAISKKEGYIQQINAATEKTIAISIIPKVRKDNMLEADREQIAQVIKTRMKELTGTPTSIAIVRKNIRPEERAVAEKPDWCKGWVYVSSSAKFTRLNNMTSMVAEAFNMIEGGNVPFSDGGESKISAASYVANHHFIDIADKVAYLPNEKGGIVERGGATYLNTFDRNSIPKTAESFTPNGLDAIEMVKKHILFVCGTDKNAKILTQWLAHQVQYTGELVHWSPIIQSIEGVGKSFFAQLLRECLGARHVGVVSPGLINSRFNDYATGVAVNIVEELRIAGHNRHEASNAIKPLLTDKIITVEKKGEGSFTTYNTTNYICFTNFRDAIPLTSTDRRWWVIFVDMKNKSEFKERMGKTSGEYFPELFGAAETHGRELRKWLLEYPITKEFRETRDAPMTEHKEAMVETEEASHVGFHETLDVLQAGGRFFNESVVSRADLFSEVRFEHPNLGLKQREETVILKKMGFMNRAEVVKIYGVTKRFWTIRPMVNAEIRDELGNMKLI
ncbi:MAG: hypothetical protein H0A75_00245 [Candidatus Methanofishera endochildressiae]|uniref:NrS-1 polymerase-like helicase domain-containing protein n=1 Tax=Candidatus Methanofishera endochildressiae TaxID=2738884 RepID=A0A7Z0SCA9_9GAMM|nr:hypothetical protein [Candidatus Methanofishera endochildressiae]